MPIDLFKIMLQLLDPNPDTRMTITHLYTLLTDDGEVVLSPPLIRDPSTPLSDEIIDAVYNVCDKHGDFEPFGLALSILG